MNVITTSEQLKDLVKAYEQEDAFCFDVETMGDHRGDPRRNRVVWISMANSSRVDVIPMGHPNGSYIRTDYPLLVSGVRRQAKGLELRPEDYSKDEKKGTKVFGPAPEQLTPVEVFKALKPLLTGDKIKIGHNLKFDLQSVTKYIKELPAEPYFCTLNAAFILNNEHRHGLGLDDCLKREFKYNMVKGVGAEIEKYTFEEVATYSGLDAEWTYKLYERYKESLETTKLTGIFNLEMDVLKVICKMELRGADIDTAQLSTLKTDVEGFLEETKGNIYKLAGRAFNINSVQEKQRILFTPKKDGGRGIKPKKMTPAGERRSSSGDTLTVHDFSVAHDALEYMRGRDPLVDELLNYSDLNKLMTTYVLPYQGGMSAKIVQGKIKTYQKDSILVNNRVHTDFVQYGTETGRFSSRNPNLQNIPAPEKADSEKQYGRMIRNLFVAGEGNKLIVADYSSIEPRIIASFSKDRIMCQAFMDQEDIYTAVGNTMGVDRKAGKELVLAIAYGVGPEKIANSLNCKIDEARDLMDGFVQRFPAITRYKRHVISTARNKAPVPYVATMMGRKRYLPNLRAREVMLRAKAERQAFNTVIQGSAADIIKLAMVRADALIPDEASLVLTVHDELVTVAPANKAEETAAAIREAMEGIKALSIPMIADVKIVDRWGEAK